MTTQRPAPEPGRGHRQGPSPAVGLPLGRRAVVVGACALGAGVAVAGCAGGTPASPAAPPTGPLAPTTAVPVGSAAIFPEQAVVVTQPTEGSFAAFSSVCPHQGCNVSSVEGAEIICPCHGSRFDLSGGVLEGPAKSGLAPRPVSAEGGSLTLG